MMAVPNNDIFGPYGRGGGRGGRGRGRGRGGSDDTDSGRGRGRGRGGGRGGLTDEDLAAIAAATRPTNIQISSESTDDVIVAATVTGGSTVQSFAFTALKENFISLNGHRQMRMFVNSCLVNLSNHHNADTTRILTGLSKPPGIARLTEILNERMYVDAGDSRDLVSFQYVILPLIGVLTREKVCQSTMTSESGMVYARVYEHRRRFLEDGVLICMDELLTRGSLQDRNPTARTVLQDPSMCKVSSLQCAMLGIVRLVYQLIRRIKDAPITMASIVEKLYEQTVRCIRLPEETPANRFPREILGREVDRLLKIVADAQNKVYEPKISSVIPPLLHEPSKSPGANLVHLLNEYDPPGELSRRERRHDNDHTEISKINVLPTLQEIMCTRGAYLPANDVPDAPHFLPAGWSRQVDIHFRLYREDMLDSLRKGLMAFKSILQKIENGDEGILLKHKELKKRLDDNVSLNVYGNVQFLGMNCLHKAGGSVKISFTQPPQLLNTNKQRRTEFWERSKRRLMQGSLVCIASRSGVSTTDDATQHSNFHMLLGVVATRDTEALARDEGFACIDISLADPKQYVSTLNTAKSHVDSSNQWFLVECTGAFFESYRPILEALQRCMPATLPFGKYLAPTQEEMEVLQATKMTIDPPLYTRAPNFTFDLSVLLRGRRPCALNTMDSQSATAAVNMLQQYSTLDDTQATALVETLCREIALISGPPGTGKTKIGVDLMRVLLHNRAVMRPGPIICICYTNHALDQFLEHLLDEGITSISRIGSRSKSEKLDNYNLESQMKLLENRTNVFNVRQALWDARERRKEVAEDINKLEKVLRSEYLAWEYIADFLMIKHPKVWEQFELPDDYDHYSGSKESTVVAEDGFTLVSRKQRLNPYEKWARGEDIKEKEERNKDAEQCKEEILKNTKKNKFAYLDDDQLALLQAPVLEHIPMTNRPLQELINDRNVWDMSMEERKRLIESWRSAAQEPMMDKMERLLQSMENISKEENDAYDHVRCGILRTKAVIGMTTNGAAKSHRLIEVLAPSIIICEEAGEVLESHILAALSPSTQHLILIGDHKQLRPQIESFHLSSDSKIGANHNLDRSLFERLVRARKNALPSSELTIQRRMRPEISSLIRNTLYPRLEDGETVLSYPNVIGMGANLFFMDHAHPEDSKDQYGMQSYANSFEVKMVEALAQYLIRNGYDQVGDIAILTPYLGQLSRLRDHLRTRFELLIDERDQEQLDQKELDNMERVGFDDGNRASMNINQHSTVGVKKVSMNSHITLRTIDNYQGEEAKIVIISLVRNDAGESLSSSYSTIGFLKSPNRANVLLSRAKHGMFILGNAGLMKHERNGIWPKVMDELERNDRVGPGFPIICKNHPNTKNIIDSPEILRTVAPNGGCTIACGRNMPCGHTCPLACHPDDEKHQLVRCFQACPRLHPVCQHACPKDCGDKCGDCMEIVSPILLKCGHVFEEPRCYQKQNPSRIVCTVKVQKQLPTCEHILEMECYQDEASIKCQVSCGAILKCDHSCIRSCYDCQEASSGPKPRCSETTSIVIPRRVHGTCLTKCDRNMYCGHACNSSCHEQPQGQPRKPCPPCTQTCEVTCAHSRCHRQCDVPCAACCESCVWSCPHEGGCSLPCGAPCDRLPCNKRCLKMLKCGHQCPSVCGERCPPKQFCVVCKNGKAMGMLVDVVLHQTLGEIDVNEDPILVMSCNHALTISSLDGMMGMSEYYHGDIDPNTGLIAFRSKKPLPQGEIKQVACHVCRKPIMGLLRYGRRIKHAQLSMRMKKFHISQQKPMKDAQEQLKVSNAMAEQHQKEFLAELRKVKAEARPEPPKIHRRKLGRSAGVTHRFPHAELWEISETYGIPTEHETAWRRNLREPFRSFMQFMELSNSALESPTKQLFEAAVSHLYRLKTLPTYDTSQDRGVGHSALVKETPIASDVIQACILECGLPLDGQGGSCYVNSLQGLTNVLLIVLTQAFAAFGHVDASTGWYWLVDDLINCTMTFASIFLEDAEKGKFERHKVYARVSRMNVAYRRMQWLGRKPMPSNEKAKKQRLKRVDETLEAFLSDNTEIRQNCPLGIIQECLSRADVLEEKMEDAYTVARGDALYVPLTEEEKMQVFTAMQQTLLGSGHFYLCPNGHPYVIGDCGQAMQEARCAECGALIGGTGHQLRSDNTANEEYEAMFQHRPA